MGEIKTRFKLEGEQQYRKAMADAAGAVKVLNSEQKLAKAQFKNTGDAEKYAAQQTEILKKKIEQQKVAVKAAEDALKQLNANGVDASSKQFQQWEMKLNAAKTALVNMETELKDVGSVMSDTSGKADQMTASINSINKKVSLDAVIKGIDGISGALDSVAKKAKEVGTAIWEDIKTAAKQADDSATMAQMYEVPLKRYLQMEALYKSGMDTSTDAILSSMSKMRKSVGKESAETMKYLKELGLVVTDTYNTGFGVVQQEKRMFTDADDLFWKTGQALMNMSSAYDKEAAASAIFGRGWRELIPLFSSYSSLEEYNAALDSMTVNSDDAISNLAELSDRLGDLERSWDTMKSELLSSLAPALSKAAEALAKLIDKITVYLQSDEGQKKLKAMEEAVSKLFGDLSKIDPDDVVNNFSAVFSGIVNSFEWIKNNWSAVQTGLLAIVAAFGAMKLATLGLNIAQIVAGMKTAIGGSSGGTGTGTAAAQSTAGRPVNAAKNGNLTSANRAHATYTSDGKIYVENMNDVVTQSVYDMAPKFRAVIAEKVSNFLTSPAGAAAVGALVAVPLINAAEEDQKTRQAGRRRFGSAYDYLTYEERKIADESGIWGMGLSDDATIEDVKATAAKKKEHDRALKPAAMPDFVMDVGDALNNVADNAINIGENAVDLIGTVINAPFNLLNERLFGDTGNGSMKTMTELLQNPLITAVTEHAGEFIQPVSDTIDNIGTTLDLGGQAMEATLKTAGESIQAGMVSFAAGIAHGVAALYNSLSSGGGSSGGSSGGGGHGVGSGTPMLELDITRQMRNRFGFANGLYSVPFNGFPAILHRGERVLTAREARTYNANSNLYVENMNMNNGMDAAALAAAMNAQNQRIRAGFGS